MTIFNRSGEAVVDKRHPDVAASYPTPPCIFVDSCSRRIICARFPICQIRLSLDGLEVDSTPSQAAFGCPLAAPL